MELESQQCDPSFSRESAQNLVRKFRPLLQLMAARSSDHEKLLGGLKDAAEETDVMAGWPRDVVIDLAAASEGDSELHRAAAGGDSECYLRCAEVAYGKDKSQLTARNGDGDTPLHCAARAGLPNMVKRLIGLAQGDGGGAETAKSMVRIRNQRGETALHEAIRSGCEKDMKNMVKYLMAVDNQLAQVEAKDGTSALFLAISLGHHSLPRELHDKYHKELSYSGPEGQNALHAVALDGFRHGKWMARRLLKWNPNLVRPPDNSGSTPLHFAASARDPSLELLLFVFGDRGFESYSFPLSLSMLPKKWIYGFYRWRKHPTFLLVDANPLSAFQPDRNGLYPAHVAASAGSLVSIIILLCHSPGCAGLRDPQGRTFLHVAVEKKMSNIVWFVARRLEYKAIMNIHDYEGNTVLHLTVLGGHWDIFRNLIGNKHVSLNLTNKHGHTPMDIALSKVPPTGFYFGMHARRRILVTLTLANGKNSFRRRDRFLEQNVPKLNEEKESEKITTFAQIVGVGSVLVATVTFAAAFTMPGGPNGTDQKIPPNGRGGTPTLAGLYAFDAFVISNTLAFICSTLATFSLVYTGVATVDIEKRIKLVAFSLALLISAARSFCAAFAFAIYVTLPPMVAHGTAMAACVMTVLALMDAFWFMPAIVTDTTVLLGREDWGSMPKRLMKLVARIIANIVYVFWPYIVIFGLLASKSITGHQEMSAPAPAPTHGL